MCTWMTEWSTNSKSAEIEKKPNLMLYIKPTPPKEYYRFRLLAFKSPKSDRDSPVIVRYVHTVWVEGEDGKRHSESIVCPVSPFVKKNWKGNPMEDCPICKFANANFGAWKVSKWGDRESGKKFREFGRKFEALIPVYVVNDPIYPQNNGHFRVFSLTDKEQYKKFKEMVQSKSHEASVFNGKNALDFYIRFETVEETLHAGQPNEYIWKHSVLKQMGFTNKAYDIPQITKEAVDEFPFDAEFYAGSTMSELEDFYNRHIKVSNDDIPEEDEEINIATIQPQKKSSSVKNQESNNIIKQTDSFSESSFNDELDDSSKTETDIDDVLNEETESKKEENFKEEIDESLKEDSKISKNEILESPKDPLKTELTDKDLDDLLSDVL